MPKSVYADPAELDRLKNICSDVLLEAKKQGADEVEVGLNIGQGLSVNARLGEVETIEHHKDQGLGLTVHIGHKKGSASSSDLKPSSIKSMVTAACSIAKHAEVDKFSGLPDTSLMATNFFDLSLHHPWDISAEQAIDIAIECEDAARTYHDDITNSEGAGIQTFEGLRVFANSHGFMHGYPSSRHSLSCSVIGGRAEGMQRDYWYSSARHANDLESAKDVGEKAAERTLKRLGARAIGTRKCPILFSPDVSGGLIGHFISAIKGGSLYRKSSFLLDSLGKNIFPDFVRIHEQPHLKKAMGSAVCDAEGVATVTRDIVSNGILQGYVLSNYSAKKLGMATTANAGGVRNLTVESGDLDFKGMLQEMNTGLLVTEMMGMGVNALTGDYSRGVAGFWVENGEIQYPVEEVTIAGNLLDMYQSITAIGNDIDLRGNTRCGSILINEMTLAGS
jgi:PmbA protein